MLPDDQTTLSTDFRKPFRKPFREPFQVGHDQARQRTERVPPMINHMEHRDRLLTVQELADYLAVPVATIYQWRYRSEGPHGFRVGSHLRYRWSEVEAWIESQLERSTTR